LLEIFRQEELAGRFDIKLFINKIICLKALGKYENALFEYENRCPAEYQSNEELLFHIAHIHYKTNNVDAAIKLISTKNILENPQNSTQFKILHLEGLLYSKNKEWQKAIKRFQLASDFEGENNISKKNILILEKALQLRNKSPTVSGILSVIPGFGYAYSSHFQTGLSAFIVNGLLTYATYTSLKTKNYGMGVLTGIFNLSFYLGNIYGSVNSAKRYNSQQHNLTIEKLEFHSTL
jgi:tetratricopeptide (TPR) repeat protein